MSVYVKDLIIYSKIEKPVFQAYLVKRIRLENILNQYINKKLIYLTSPAGFGKTTLLVQWTDTLKQDIAWFSVDESDNEIKNFLRYLIVSIQKSINPNFGKEILGELNTNITDIGKIVTLLINEFIIYPDYYLVFIDNYQNIINTETRKIINWIITNLPKNVSFFISSRNKDSYLDLDKFRAKNQLIELTVNDLKFSFAELKEFFKLKQLTLEEETLELIDKKTEGWVLSLHLASFFIIKNKNINFPQDLENKYLFDFIFNEILENLEKDKVDFLLKTSLLPCFNYELANKVNKIKTSDSIINYLEQNNLFIISLDNSGEYFRYHNLFAKLLEKKFKRVFDTETEIEIREVALNWYLEHNFYLYALKQLFILDKQDRILETLNKIINQEYYNVDNSCLKYLDSIAIEKLIKFEQVLFFYLQKLVYDFNFSKVEKIFNFIQDNKILISEEINKYILFSKAYKLYLEDKIDESSKYIEKCLALNNEDDFMLSKCYIALSSIYTRKLKLKEAIIMLNKGLAFFQKKESLELEILSDMLFTLIALNNFSEAEEKCNYIIEKVEEIRYSHNYEAIKLKLTIARLNINFYRNKDIHEFIELLLEYLPKVKNLALVCYIYTNIVNVLISLHRFQDAEDLIEKLESIDNEYLDNEIKFLKIRLYLYKEPKKALDIYKDLDSIVDTTEPSLFLIILNLYISLNDLDLATEMIELFLTNHPETDTIYYIYILIFKAIIAYKSDVILNKETYLNLILKAIKVSEKSNITAIFSEFSDDINELISNILTEINKKVRDSISSNIDLKHLDKIIILSYQKTNKEVSENIVSDISLTKREIELLKVLEERISNSEISEKLHISLNTLKTHIKNIYKKLNVNNREEALIKYKAIIGNR